MTDAPTNSPLAEHQSFLCAIAGTPADLSLHQVYADWLEERADPRSMCLRAWIELVRFRYHDSTSRQFLALVEQYQARLKEVDLEWVIALAVARDWVNESLAEKSARLHLRIHDGRMVDRQWLERGEPAGRAHEDFWSLVSYHKLPPRDKGRGARSDHLWVDRVTAEVHNTGQRYSIPETGWKLREAMQSPQYREIQQARQQRT